jgi:GNAT superfamily N-acetyltransferase
MDRMLIREAKAADAAAMAKVNIDSWRMTYAGIVPQGYLDSLSYEQLTNNFQARLSDPNKLRPGWFYYVAEDDQGNIVGMAGGGPSRDGNKLYTGELGVIYLLKSHQRQGIGRQLMATVARKLKQQGHKSMLVWVMAANQYKVFYEALGGRPFAEKEVNVGGANLVEVAYGWRDLGTFIKILKPTPAPVK